jgi:hypothetical protein
VPWLQLDQAAIDRVRLSSQRGRLRQQGQTLLQRLDERPGHEQAILTFSMCIFKRLHQNQQTFFNLSLCFTLILLRVPYAFRAIIICTSIRHGSLKEFDFAYELYKRAQTTLIEKDTLAALSCASDTWLLSRYLDEHLSETRPPSANSDAVSERKDVLLAIRNVAAKPQGSLLAWTFLKINWNSIYEKQARLVSIFRLLASFELWFSFIFILLTFFLSSITIIIIKAI